MDIKYTIDFLGNPSLTQQPELEDVAEPRKKINAILAFGEFFARRGQAAGAQSAFYEFNNGWQVAIRKGNADDYIVVKHPDLQAEEQAFSLRGMNDFIAGGFQGYTLQSFKLDEAANAVKAVDHALMIHARQFQDARKESLRDEASKLANQ